MSICKECEHKKDCSLFQEKSKSICSAFEKQSDVEIVVTQK